MPAWFFPFTRMRRELRKQGYDISLSSRTDKYQFSIRRSNVPTEETIAIADTGLGYWPTVTMLRNDLALKQIARKYARVEGPAPFGIL